MKTWALRFAFCAVFAIGLFLNASAQTVTEPTKAGVIKVGKVEGKAFRSTKSGESTELKAGDTLIETDTVTTEQKSSVVLVFMNGSSVKLGADTKLEIAEFKMDPLAEDIVVAKLQSEPSVSKTKLKLSHGEMVGDVKKLNKSSSYAIETPVGAAGIRGTQFRIVFRPTGDGRSFTFQLQTAEGRVVFEGSAQAPANVDVPQGQEVVVTAEATVDATTGAVQITKVEVPAAASTLSTQDSAAIVQVAQTVLQEAAVQTTISTVEQQAAASTPTNTGSSGNTNNTSNSSDSNSNSSNNSNTDNSNNTNNSNNSNNTPAQNTNPNPPAQNTTRPPTLTSGAGG
jgi:hypothetical protein